MSNSFHSAFNIQCNHPRSSQLPGPRTIAEAKSKTPSPPETLIWGKEEFDEVGSPPPNLTEAWKHSSIPHFDLGYKASPIWEYSPFVCYSFFFLIYFLTLLRLLEKNIPVLYRFCLEEIVFNPKWTTLYYKNPLCLFEMLQKCNIGSKINTPPAIWTTGSVRCTWERSATPTWPRRRVPFGWAHKCLLPPLPHESGPISPSSDRCSTCQSKRRLYGTLLERLDSRDVCSF